MRLLPLRAVTARTSEWPRRATKPRIDGKIGPLLARTTSARLADNSRQPTQVIEQAVMTKYVQRYQRIRTLALSAGLVIGMVAGTVGPQLAQAAAIKTAKRAPAKAEKFVPLPEATPEQMQAADRVLIGRYECEFGKQIAIDRNDTNKGYFNLKLAKQSWVMKPVQSSTGAIRLEDVKGNTLLIQILTKSMLMDVKAGHRMVDGCVHEVQRAAEAELAKQPPRPSLFDAPAGN
jgi:hypothetical protein